MKNAFLFSLLFTVILCNNSLSQSLWDNTNGPYGGDIRSITTNSVGWIFAATDYSGTYRSTDNGQHWEQINTGLPLNYIQSLVFNSQNQLFAGHLNNGVYRSDDNGETWFSVNNGLWSTNVTNLGINTNDDLFAVTGSGIFRSEDNGQNWEEIDNGLGNDSHFISSIAINMQGIIFIGIKHNDTFGSVYRSTDNGNSWIQANNGINQFESSIASLAINSLGYIFAGTWGYGFYRSTDNGENWTQYTFGAYPYVKSFAINSSDHIYAGTIWGIFKSTDNGETWNPAGNELSTSYILSLKINQNYIFAGTKYGRGIFCSSDNGNSWQQINEGMTGIYLISLAISPNNYIFAGSYGGAFRSTDTGQTWEQVNNGLDYPWVRALISDPNGYIFAGTELGGGVFRSTNNGNSWAQVNNGIPFPTYIFSFGLNQNGNIFAGAYEGNIFRSTNSGTTWTEIHVGGVTTEINCIITDSSNNMYCGSSGEGVWKSTNDGQTWIPASNGLLPPYDIRDLLVAQNNSIYAASMQNGIFCSTNNGLNWAQVNTGLSSSNFYSLCMNSKGDIFAGAVDGIFRSTDNGNSWEDIHEGLTNNRVQNIEVDSNDYLYAGTVFGGIFRSSFPTPVELTSFTASVSGNSVMLNWKTSTEINNKGFAVERKSVPPNQSINQPVSPTGGSSNQWLEIGFVGGFGTMTEPKSYSFTDNNVTTGNYSYRLKQIDFDGSYKYSNVVEVEINKVTEFSLRQNYPNPFNPNTIINYQLPIDNFVTLKVYNTLGEEVAVLVNEQKPAGSYSVKFDGSRLPSGVYIYRLTAGNYTQSRKLLLLK